MVSNQADKPVIVFENGRGSTFDDEFHSKLENNSATIW